MTSQTSRYECLCLSIPASTEPLGDDLGRFAEALNLVQWLKASGAARERSLYAFGTRAEGVSYRGMDAEGHFMTTTISSPTRNNSGLAFPKKGVGRGCHDLLLPTLWGVASLRRTVCILTLPCGHYWGDYPEAKPRPMNFWRDGPNSARADKALFTLLRDSPSAAVAKSVFGCQTGVK